MQQGIGLTPLLLIIPEECSQINNTVKSAYVKLIWTEEIALTQRKFDLCEVKKKRK